MKPFPELTFSFEWESLLLKEDLTIPDPREVREVANLIRSMVYGSEMGLDYIQRVGPMLEIRPGILRGAEELSTRIEEHLRAIHKECEKRRLLFLPCGTHPALGNAIGLHVHIGSIYDSRDAVRIANGLLKYSPCFAALATNSPVYGDLVGEYKSYRLLFHAQFCSITRALVSPRLAQWRWAEDISVKVDLHSTLELRIGDSASSRQFIEEYVLFVTAFFLSDWEEKLDEKGYEEYIINRWRASRYGLQAIFQWDGEETPVVELLKDMLKVSKFKTLKAGELRLIPIMLEKRQTQADWQMEIYRDISDPFAYTRLLIDLLKRGDPFMNYMEGAEKLPLLKPESIDKYILSHIHKDTPYTLLYELLLLPYALLDRHLQSLIKSGKIRMQCDPRYGKRFTRV